MGGQMLSTGIHHILGLSRYQGTVRVGNEGRNYGSHAVSEVVGISGMDGRVSGHKADGDLSLTFLNSVGSQMLGTGINDFLGLSGHQSTVRVGNEGGNNGSDAVSEVVGVSETSDGGVSGDQVNGDLSLTFLNSVSSQMLSTGINYFLGLSRYQGTVRVGNEGGNNGSHAVSEVGVSDVGVSSDQVDGKLSLTLLTSIHSSSRMYSKSSSIWEVASMSDLGCVMVCGGDGYVRVEGSHSTVRVGDQLGCAARN